MNSKKVNTVRMGKLQKHLLLWIGTRCEIHALTNRDEALTLLGVLQEIYENPMELKENLSNDDLFFSDVTKATFIALMEEIKKPWEGNEELFLSRLEEGGLDHPDTLLVKFDTEYKLPTSRVVSWSGSVFLKRPPSRSEAANLSKTLRSLERRKLIRRYEARGKLRRGKKTTRVMLTAGGAVFCIAYWLKMYFEFIEVQNKGYVLELRSIVVQRKALALYNATLEEHNSLYEVV